MDIKTAIAQVIENNDLTQAQMVAVMRQIMTGEASPEQIAGFLVALRMKGESLDEITGAVMVMRELASGVSVSGEHLVDIVGTGGDGASLFNVSTASAFVVAVSGGRVVKHGNRSVSSKSGSADLLEAAGVRLDLNSAQVAHCVADVGIGFMFAPQHHSAMRHAAGPRKALGVRTLFNILGPMTNPAGVKRQLIGVFDVALCKPVAQVLQRLGSEHIMVVHSDDGLDEISLVGGTSVAELHNGEIREYRIAPTDFGIVEQNLDGLGVADAAHSLVLIRDALGSRPTALGRKAGDIIALNAGAAIYVSGVAANLAEGIAMAQDGIASGLALEKLDELAAFSTLLTD
ncbi:MAG: anthranilate phosphoribosyltransferase [Gammaproteobacteria bacterium]|nr:anthranilate phosphoribosyltransferase [Gammaproteobacteria bacterium]MBQ0840850.1 anthranilate phosphoribosyltransferase [Gammaproteobacteria bacterium]